MAFSNSYVLQKFAFLFVDNMRCSSGYSIASQNRSFLYIPLIFKSLKSVLETFRIAIGFLRHYVLQSFPMYAPRIHYFFLGRYGCNSDLSSYASLHGEEIRSLLLLIIFQIDALFSFIFFNALSIKTLLRLS